MRKAYFMVAVLGLFLIIIARGAYAPQTQNAQDVIKVGSVPVRIERAISEAQRERGLMYRDYLDKDSGMLFIFPDTAPQAFWNKNTSIPLDVVWIRDNFIVGVSELPAMNDGQITVLSNEAVNAVLEVNRGFITSRGIRVGDKIIFE
jgi:uncharacterized membrane protein (UPF0127 family)